MRYSLIHKKDLLMINLGMRVQINPLVGAELRVLVTLVMHLVIFLVIFLVVSKARDQTSIEEQIFGITWKLHQKMPLKVLKPKYEFQYYQLVKLVVEVVQKKGQSLSLVKHVRVMVKLECNKVFFPFNKPVMNAKERERLSRIHVKIVMVQDG